MVNMQNFITELQGLGVLEAEEEIFIALVEYEVLRALSGAPLATPARLQARPGMETVSHVATRRRQLRGLAVKGGAQ